MAAVVADGNGLAAGDRLMEAVRAAGPAALVVAASPKALSLGVRDQHETLRGLTRAGPRTVFVTG